MCVDKRGKIGGRVKGKRVKRSLKKLLILNFGF